MTAIELFELPHCEGRDGIHICAQLRVDAMQLEGRVGWAARTMETAANRIEMLEVLVSHLSAALEAVNDDLHQSDETGFWSCGPWADPNTGEGQGGKVQMIREAIAHYRPQS